MPAKLSVWVLFLALVVSRVSFGQDQPNDPPVPEFDQQIVWTYGLYNYILELVPANFPPPVITTRTLALPLYPDGEYYLYDSTGERKHLQNPNLNATVKLVNGNQLSITIENCTKGTIVLDLGAQATPTHLAYDYLFVPFRVNNNIPNPLPVGWFVDVYRTKKEFVRYSGKVRARKVLPSGALWEDWVEGFNDSQVTKLVGVRRYRVVAARFVAIGGGGGWNPIQPVEP